MTIEFVSPIMRLVQGSLSLETKNDPTTGKPKLDENGQPIKECFIALAIRKDDPNLGTFYSLFTAAAKAEFPHLFDAAGNCTHPRFAMKWQDGDGVDNSGKSVADKPGFAGHWIVKMGTRYMPKCYYEGKFDATQQIQDPNSVIKRGYFVRVAGTIRGNGVTPNDRQAVPGLFVSPNLVSFVRPGDEIVGGPDAAKTFGSAPLPAGTVVEHTPMSPPAGGPGGLTPPPSPGMGGPAAPAAPGVPVAAPAGPAAPVAAPAGPVAPVAAPVAPAAPLPPPVPAGPQYQMTASANGVTREALIALGWTDETLIQHGHMVVVG